MNERQSILIVEDIATESDFLSEILRDFPCDVAKTFDEALEVVNETTYGLILLDLKLDDIEPNQTLSRLPKLLNHSLNGDIWVIVTTPSLDPQLAKTAVANERVYDYFIKPLFIDEFVSRVTEALSNQEPRALKLNRYEAITGRIDRIIDSIPNHAERVATLAVNVLLQLGAKAKEIERCYLLALLHDIGKLRLENLWHALLRDTKIQSITDVNAHLEPLGNDERLMRLIPRLFRFRANLYHFYETFDPAESEQTFGHKSVQLATAIALADAYDVIAYCKQKAGVFSLDDTIEKLEALDFPEPFVTALRTYVLDELSQLRASVGTDLHQLQTVFANATARHAAGENLHQTLRQLELLARHSGFDKLSRVAAVLGDTLRSTPPEDFGNAQLQAFIEACRQVTDVQPNDVEPKSVLRALWQAGLDWLPPTLEMVTDAKGLDDREEPIA